MKEQEILEEVDKILENVKDVRRNLIFIPRENEEEMDEFLWK